MNLKKLVAAFIVVLFIFVAAPKSASAATIEFTCITDKTGNCSNYAQDFLGSVTVSGTQMTATIGNFGSDGFIGQIYVDFTDPVTGFTFNAITGGQGTSFTQGSGNIPGADAAHEFDSDFAFDAAPPPSQNGVNSGEYFRVVFDLLPGQTQDDIDNLLLTGDIRFGLHVQSLGGSEKSESLVSIPSLKADPFCDTSDECNPTAVPEPATMLLLGTGLLAVARARRKKTS